MGATYWKRTQAINFESKRDRILEVLDFLLEGSSEEKAGIKSKLQMKAE